MCKLDALCPCEQLTTRLRMWPSCFAGTGSFFPTAGTAAHRLSQNKVKRFSSFLKPLGVWVQVSAVTAACGHKMASSSSACLLFRIPLLRRADGQVTRAGETLLRSVQVCSECVFVSVRNSFWRFYTSVIFKPSLCFKWLLKHITSAIC